jgi:hypothetical protein
MIEIKLELKLDSFIVNCIGGSGDQSGVMPTKALRFICENIASVRQLTGNAPTADFEFLGGATQREAKVDPDQEFDNKLLKYLTTHTTVDVSSITVSSEASGYSTMPKGENTGEIGRITFTKLPDQSRMDIELVLKSAEFDSTWALMTGYHIQYANTTLVCFRLKQGTPPPQSETSYVAGIFSSSLQIVPRSGN